MGMSYAIAPSKPLYMRPAAAPEVGGAIRASNAATGARAVEVLRRALCSPENAFAPQHGVRPDPNRRVKRRKATSAVGRARLGDRQ